jgi:hypothetical protein
MMMIAQLARLPKHARGKVDAVDASGRSDRFAQEREIPPVPHPTFCIFDAQPARPPYASVVTTTESEVTEITETQIRAVSMENEDTNFFYFVALVTARTSPTCGT